MGERDGRPYTVEEWRDVPVVRSPSQVVLLPQPSYCRIESGICFISKGHVKFNGGIEKVIFSVGTGAGRPMMLELVLFTTQSHQAEQVLYRTLCSLIGITEKGIVGVKTQLIRDVKHFSVGYLNLPQTAQRLEVAVYKMKIV